MKRSLFLLFAIVSVAGMIAFSGCDTNVTTYTVTFDANGGTGVMEPQTFTGSVNKALTLNKFTREGYGFAEWNTIPDGTGVRYMDGQEISASNDMTLYAQWTADSILHPSDTTGNTFVVTFDANGGTGSMQPQTFTKDVAQALTLNAFTRENYSFYCWDTVPDGAGLYLDGQEITVTSDMTLYAKWTEDTPGPVSVVVTFNANGGTGTMQPQTFQSGVRQELTANAFTREGYTFVKWNTIADGSGLHYYDEQDIVIYESMTLYAQWSSNGGTQGEGQLNGHAYIDLGLPSGNMWATCNIGADVPEAAGNYYAWAETAPKQTYTTENYPYIRIVVEGEDTLRKLTKYCPYSAYGYEGFTDELASLLAEDDAAAVNWGGQWKTPSEDDYLELIENCTITTDTINNVVGLTFKGTNGNSIFMPAVRYYSDEGLADYVCGRYWTSTLATDISYTDPVCAMNCTFYLENEYATVYPWVRDCGLPVRAICNISK
jgi:uncharacterized repeat protein (TIGR02543 family)